MSINIAAWCKLVNEKFGPLGWVGTLDIGTNAITLKPMDATISIMRKHMVEENDAREAYVDSLASSLSSLYSSMHAHRTSIGDGER
jgi:hypothetical protein